jgi:hypothetical protein
MIRSLRTATIALAALAAPVLLGACGDDAATDLDVEAVDYTFEDIPANVAVGTRMHLRNTSDSEVYEAVVFRVAPERATTPLVVVCFVPTGADPAIYREALATGTPPDVADGVPHVAHGMVAELTVD